MHKGLIYWNDCLGNNNNKHNSRNYFYIYFWYGYVLFPTQNWTFLVFVKLKFGK